MSSEEARQLQAEIDEMKVRLYTVLVICTNHLSFITLFIQS
jgi:hypothetical protein